MNVWVLGLGATYGGVRAEREPGLDPVGHASEWIDPETADWFATSSLELGRGPEPAERDAARAPELDHWFG
jgi:hypothetical protein